MTSDKREPRPGGNGCGSLKIIAADSYDGPELSPQALEKQALLRPRSDFARDAVFAEFRYRDARAIDYHGFADRKPAQRLRVWRYGRAA